MVDTKYTHVKHPVSGRTDENRRSVTFIQALTTKSENIYCVGNGEKFIFNNSLCVCVCLYVCTRSKRTKQCGGNSKIHLMIDQPR